MRIGGGRCNCAHCQFITKVILFVETDESSRFAMFSKFEQDLEMSDVKFYFTMDDRANVPVETHAQAWH